MHPIAGSEQCTWKWEPIAIVPGLYTVLRILEERLSSRYTTSQAWLIPGLFLREGDKLDITGDHVRHCLA